MRHSALLMKRSPFFLAISLVSGWSVAQTTPATNADDLEEIVIVGNYLNSLQSATSVKKNSTSIVEAIAAEDIGQLPDVSISDSLKRLPGLAQDRDRGNGSQISIRGMGGMLGFTTLNGREVAILEETRNIRYDQFPSELVNGAQVYKTPQASLQEGGVSGSVNLDTIKPLDHKKREFVVDLRGTSYDLGKDIDAAAHDGIGQRISVSYIDQFLDDTLGVAIGYSGRSEPVAAKRTELWNYGDRYHNAIWSEELNTALAAPWGGSSLVIGGEDKRQGVVGTVSWEPNDYLTVNYDGFWSAFDIHENYQGFDYGIKAWGTEPIIDKLIPTAYDNVDGTNPDGTSKGKYDLLGGTVDLASLRNLNEVYDQDDELISHGVNLEWQEGAWTSTLDLATSETTRDKLWASVRTENTNPGRATFGTTSDGRMIVDLLTADLTSTTQNRFATVRIEPASEGGDEINSAKLDFKYDILGDFVKDIKFGAALSNREKYELIQKWDQAPLNGANVLTPNYIVGTQEAYFDGLPDYLVLDVNAVIKGVYGGLKNPTPLDGDDLVASWNVSEDISSQYIQLDFASEILGRSVSGNFGVRNVNTETLSQGYEQAVNGTVTKVSTPHDYNDVLPSTNWVINLTEEHLIRIGAAKTIARAPVNMMSASLNLNEDVGEPNPGQSTSGNPKLDPFRADQADLAYEWYYSDNSQVAVNLFYKDLESYITRSAEAETVTRNGVNYDVSRPVNGSGGYIRGYELLWQQAFDFLPSPFNGLGVYTNYSHNESNVEQAVPLHSSFKAPLTGLSEDVANFTLWYYLSGFEARTSYTYRSEFQRDINLVKGEEGMNGAEGYWDLNLSYSFNDHYKVYFQVQNLTNEPYKTYGLESNNPSHVNRYEEFGSRYSVGFNWKL